MSAFAPRPALADSQRRNPHLRTIWPCSQFLCGESTLEAPHWRCHFLGDIKAEAGCARHTRLNTHPSKKGFEPPFFFSFFFFFFKMQCLYWAEMMKIKFWFSAIVTEFHLSLQIEECLVLNSPPLRALPCACTVACVRAQTCVRMAK